tara:strand:+ start:195 stop:824 length:630 start_codon:yes stop_codon:yes gene_type:complete
MYDPKRKLLFVHVAKSGGSSVVYYYTRGVFPELKTEESEHVIYQNYVKQNFLVDPFAPIKPNGKPLHELGPHAWITQYEKFLNLDEYFKFSIIREPANYCFSNFYEFPEAFKSKNYTEYILSGEFKEKTDSQHAHFIDSKGKIRIDKFFKFEKFNEVFDFISEFLGDTDIPKGNSNNKPYGKLLNENTQEIKDIVNNHFKQDYEFWNTL